MPFLKAPPTESPQILIAVIGGAVLQRLQSKALTGCSGWPLWRIAVPVAEAVRHIRIGCQLSPEAVFALFSRIRSWLRAVLSDLLPRASRIKARASACMLTAGCSRIASTRPSHSKCSRAAQGSLISGMARIASSISTMKTLASMFLSAGAFMIFVQNRWTASAQTTGPARCPVRGRYPKPKIALCCLGIRDFALGRRRGEQASKD